MANVCSMADNLYNCMCVASIGVCGQEPLPRFRDEGSWVEQCGGGVRQELVWKGVCDV